MPVDADDLLSSRLVAFLRSSRDQNGYIAMRGYIFEPGGALADFPFKNWNVDGIHSICGTCAAFHIGGEDLQEGGTRAREILKETTKNGHVYNWGNSRDRSLD